MHAGKTNVLRIVLAGLIAVFLMGLNSCVEVNSKGNLIGVVVRGEEMEIVQNPVILIGPAGQDEFTAELVVKGDTEGRFSVTVEEGSYQVAISTDPEGPFMLYEKAIPITSDYTTVRLFQLQGES